MNRTTFLPAAAACVIGAAGAVLRLAHTRTCYEESGFIVKHHPLTWLLAAAILAVILLGVIVGILSSVRRRKEQPDDVTSAVPLPALCAAAGLVAAAGAVWQFLAASQRTGLLTVSSVLGLAAAAGALAMARRPAGRKALMWSCAAVGVFFCMELVRHFAANTLNPVTLSFGPECLGLGAASLFAFCLGAARGQVSGFGTVCFGLCAAGLCLTALTGPQITWPDRLILLEGTLFSLSVLVKLPLSGKAGNISSDI